MELVKDELERLQKPTAHQIPKKSIPEFSLLVHSALVVLSVYSSNLYIFLFHAAYITCYIVFSLGSIYFIEK